MTLLTVHSRKVGILMSSVLGHENEFVFSAELFLYSGILYLCAVGLRLAENTGSDVFVSMMSYKWSCSVTSCWQLAEHTSSIVLTACRTHFVDRADSLPDTLLRQLVPDYTVNCGEERVRLLFLSILLFFPLFSLFRNFAYVSPSAQRGEQTRSLFDHSQTSVLLLEIQWRSVKKCFALSASATLQR